MRVFVTIHDGYLEKLKELGIYRGRGSRQMSIYMNNLIYSDLAQDGAWFKKESGDSDKGRAVGDHTLAQGPGGQAAGSRVEQQQPDHDQDQHG